MRISNWSSGVCSSDLCPIARRREQLAAIARPADHAHNTTKRHDTRHTTRPCQQALAHAHVLKAVPDRKSVVQGKSVSVRVDLGGRRRMRKTLYTPLA